MKKMSKSSLASDSRSNILRSQSKKVSNVYLVECRVSLNHPAKKKRKMPSMCVVPNKTARNNSRSYP